MKIRNMVLLTGLAGLAYYLYQKKEQVLETGQALATEGQEIVGNVNRFQTNLEEVQKQALLAQETFKDLPYKINSFSNVANARLEEIQSIWSKYQAQEEK